MATRTIESERDRKTTIMVLPLMSCGARLPIYALIIPAFFVQKYQAFVMWLMYFIGVVIALIAARIMKSTLFKGDGEVYLMELPPYRVPTLRSLLLHMWDRGRMYLQKAGTIILATSVILYICNTYPEKKDFSKDYEGEIAQIEETQLLTDEQIAVLEAAAQTEALAEIFGEDVMKEIKENKVVPDEALEALGEEEDLELAEDVQGVIDAAQERADAIAALENEQMAEAMEYTISGRVGHALEPLFRPIGFDWKLTTASIGALAAKEVFVAQLGILYSEGEADEESVPLREQLVKNYTPLQGFCIMLFCLLSIPCLATLAIIRRELNSWTMPFAEAGGLLALAYILTMIVYQLGSVLHIGTKLLGS
jgi:ferrous iron transport protein B